MRQLHSRRVLVVEDEFVIALELQHAIEVEGAAVVLASCVRTGLGAIETAAAYGQPIDVAVLDVRLGTEDVFPVADELERRGVPIVFHSGHAAPAVLEAKYPAAVTLTKPAPPPRLIGAVSDQLG